MELINVEVIVRIAELRLSIFSIVYLEYTNSSNPNYEIDIKQYTSFDVVG